MVSLNDYLKKHGLPIDTSFLKPSKKDNDLSSIESIVLDVFRTKQKNNSSVVLLDVDYIYKKLINNNNKINHESVRAVLKCLSVRGYLSHASNNQYSLKNS